MLNLTAAKFLHGCTGRNLDILAREPLQRCPLNRPLPYERVLPDFLWPLIFPSDYHPPRFPHCPAESDQERAVSDELRQYAEENGITIKNYDEIAEFLGTAPHPFHNG